MIATILVSIVLLLIGIFFMGFKLFFFKNGSFPSGHISSIKPLKDQGISCATSQDREAQKKNKRTKTYSINN